jgi:hypothetical protein
VGEREQRIRRRAGRYFWPRVNCEQVPVLPARVVRLFLDDPRRVPYLVVWVNPKDGTLGEGVRVGRYSDPPNQFNVDWTGWILINQINGRARL